MLFYCATESLNVEFIWNNSLRTVKGIAVRVGKYETA